MSPFKTFEEILAWQKAHAAVLNLYQLTNGDLLSKDFALRDQMRRSAISISSNIAEGHERHSDKEFFHFLNIAKASAAELRSQLLIALDLKYITQEEHIQIREQLIETAKLISGLMKYLKSS
jgi:four helix bundle protein